MLEHRRPRPSLVVWVVEISAALFKFGNRVRPRLTSWQMMVSIFLQVPSLFGLGVAVRLKSVRVHSVRTRSCGKWLRRHTFPLLSAPVLVPYKYLQVPAT